MKKIMEDGTECELMATVEVYRVCGEPNEFRSSYNATDEAIEGEAGGVMLQIATALRGLANDCAHRAMLAIMLSEVMGLKPGAEKKDGAGPSKADIEEALKAMERASK